MLYYLCQRDGRIVLDREVVGVPMESIEVHEPPLIKRWVKDGECVRLEDVPDYAVSYAAARWQVDEKDLIRTPEGWFGSKIDYRAYVESRLGGAD